MKKIYKLLSLSALLLPLQSFAAPNYCPTRDFVAQQQVTELVDEQDGDFAAVANVVDDNGMYWELKMYSDAIRDTSQETLLKANELMKTVKNPVFTTPENTDNGSEATCFYPGDDETHTRVGLVYHVK